MAGNGFGYRTCTELAGEPRVRVWKVGRLGHWVRQYGWMKGAGRVPVLIASLLEGA